MKKKSNNIPWRLRVSWPFAASLLLHAMVGAVLIYAATRPAEKKDTVRLSVVKTVPVPVQPVEKPPPPPPPKPPPKKITKPIDLTKPIPKPKEDKLLPPVQADQVADNNSAPPPQGAGVSNSLTSEKGTFSVAAGGTAMGDPSKPVKEGAKAGPEVKEFSPVPVARVTRMPELISDFKVQFPEEARRMGVEGKVVLRLEIDENGRVVGSKVIKSVGHGLDEAARTASLKFVFKPAMVGDQPVSVRIMYTYTFILEE